MGNTATELGRASASGNPSVAVTVPAGATDLVAFSINAGGGVQTTGLSVTDTLGATWTNTAQFANVPNSSKVGTLWVCRGPASGARTVTFTKNAANSVGAISVYALTGTAGSDVAASGTFAGNGSTQTSTVTTAGAAAAAGELAFAGMAQDNESGTTIGPGPGYTLGDQLADPTIGGASMGAVEYDLAAGGGTVGAGFTDSTDVGIALVVFKLAPSPYPFPTIRRLMEWDY